MKDKSDDTVPGSCALMDQFLPGNKSFVPSGLTLQPFSIKY
jgi:hypothetical protein